MTKIQKREDISTSDRSLGQLLTVKETAIYLRVCIRTINKLIHDLQIGHVKIGSRVLIPTKSINTYLEKHYVAPFDSKNIARRVLERDI
jgi:excisionase family DNA binding protein